jgi:diadenosine tetraphosphate (Ap4A) HIT family hydrolase
LSCFVCEKHRDVDAVLEDDHVVVAHLPLTTPAGTAETVYLGYLIVEPRRHVAELGELTPEEAAAFGQAAARASAVLQAHGAEHVYAAIVGHAVDHLHLHLIPRYPGTPRDYWWTRVDEWPDAPRGDASDIAALTQRLRALL